MLFVKKFSFSVLVLLLDKFFTTAEILAPPHYILDIAYIIHNI